MFSGTIQSDYGEVGTLSGPLQPLTTRITQQNQRIEGGGREAFFIMKYYISLIIALIIGLALFERPNTVVPEPVKKPEPVEPVGAKESVGAESEPPTATF